MTLSINSSKIDIFEYKDKLKKKDIFNIFEIDNENIMTSVECNNSNYICKTCYIRI